MVTKAFHLISNPRWLLIILTLLSCAYDGYAQDSFLNPTNFKYNIEYSSELPNDTLSATVGLLTVRFDNDLKTSFCTLRYNNHIRFQGRVIDVQLNRDRQLFKLANFFGNSQPADMTIIKSTEISDQKVALIYPSGVNKDTTNEQKFICLLLTDFINDKGGTPPAPTNTQP